MDFEDSVDDVFGLRARNQYDRTDVEIAPVELLAADDVLEGYAGHAFIDGVFQALGFFFAKNALVVGVEIFAPDGKAVCQQDLSRESRVRYSMKLATLGC